jgi:hypothetical protein
MVFIHLPDSEVILNEDCSLLIQVGVHCLGSLYSAGPWSSTRGVLTIALVWGLARRALVSANRKGDTS